MSHSIFEENAQHIISELNEVFEKLNQSEVKNFINGILKADKVFVIGVGRVKIALSAFVKRLNHLGIKAWLVGDVNEPKITDKDLF